MVYGHCLDIVTDYMRIRIGTRFESRYNYRCDQMCKKKGEESGLRSACLPEINVPGIGSSAGQRSGSSARERSFAPEACKATSSTSKQRKVSVEGRPLALGYREEHESA